MKARFVRSALALFLASIGVLGIAPSAHAVSIPRVNVHKYNGNELDVSITSYAGQEVDVHIITLGTYGVIDSKQEIDMEIPGECSPVQPSGDPNFPNRMVCAGVTSPYVLAVGGTGTNFIWTQAVGKTTFVFGGPHANYFIGSGYSTDNFFENGGTGGLLDVRQPTQPGYANHDSVNCGGNKNIAVYAKPGDSVGSGCNPNLTTIGTGAGEGI
jgi:hypothetical protein